MVHYTDKSGKKRKREKERVYSVYCCCCDSSSSCVSDRMPLLPSSPFNSKSKLEMLTGNVEIFMFAVKINPSIQESIFDVLHLFSFSLSFLFVFMSSQTYSRN